ncbi:MAG: Fur family transcriptional regulator [Candidatus Sumerlaeia bacterium]
MDNGKTIAHQNKGHDDGNGQKIKRQPVNMEKAWEEFVAELRKEGARITTARRIVFEDVMLRHDHFRADELAGELARGHNRVSRGTVYRTLALMVKTGFVRAIRDEDTHQHYEHVYGHSHHEHMICDSCGEFIEFSVPEVAELIKKQCKHMGFEERSHRLTVFGICNKCRDKEE